MKKTFLLLLTVVMNLNLSAQEIRIKTGIEVLNPHCSF